MAGLDRIASEDFSTLETVGVVVLFNLIMLLLIELPLIGYAIAPDWTPKAVPASKRASTATAVAGECAEPPSSAFF